MTEMFIGIDPGATGGIVGLWADGTVAFSSALGSVSWFCSLLRDLSKDENVTYVIGLEKAQAFPGQGVVSMFNYGVGFGQLQGALIALGCGFDLIPPQRWTKVMHEGTKVTYSKDRSLQAAKRLFPDMNLKNLDKPRSKKDHEGLIDALLIAEYIRRKYNARRL